MGPEYEVIYSYALNSFPDEMFADEYYQKICKLRDRYRKVFSSLEKCSGDLAFVRFNGGESKSVKGRLSGFTRDGDNSHFFVGGRKVYFKNVKLLALKPFFEKDYSGGNFWDDPGYQGETNLEL